MHYTIAGIRIDLPDRLVRDRFAEALHPFADLHSGAVDPASETRADHRPETGASSTHPHRPEDLARTTEAHTSQPSCPEILLPKTGASSSHSSLTADLMLASAAQIPALPDFRELCRFDFADAGADCLFGHDSAGCLLEMTPRDGSAPARFRMASDSAQALTDTSPTHNPALFRFGVWTLFNIAALRCGAVSIHASAVQYRNRGVLFLGESGTGKSTHTRMWQEYIPGASLLNDDSPVIRATDREARVYGSPWSGKTPCYRNESCPIAAVVRLSQAPHNRIRRLRPIEAIGALLPSAPPTFARDERLSDAVCAVLSRVIAQVPVYRLECLPDGDAARLACRTIFNDTAL